MVEQALLLLKIVFLTLLYLFIWQVVRTAARDLRLPQESFVLPPPPGAGPASQSPLGRVVVVSRQGAGPDGSYELSASPLTIGRSGENTVVVSDEFASSRHARIEVLRDGVWVVDLASTNGTLVNGSRLNERRRLEPGDTVSVGGTELRYER